MCLFPFRFNYNLNLDKSVYIRPKNFSYGQLFTARAECPLAHCYYILPFFMGKAMEFEALEIEILEEVIL